MAASRVRAGVTRARRRTFSHSVFPHPNLGEAGAQFTHKSRGEAGRNLGSSTATRTSHLPTPARLWKNYALRIGARREEENL